MSVERLAFTVGPFGQGFERFGLEFPVVLEEDFYLALCLIEFLAAGIRELDAFFEELQSLFKGNLPFLELIHDFFQPLKAVFKLGQGPSLLETF
jgi:hypothetical protein